MRRAELEHLVRSACAITNQDGILIIGSQSVLGTYSEYELPEDTTLSIEADFVPLHDDDAESLSMLIDATIGEMSIFQDTFGYYAQGVGKRTAVLPPGWASRLVPIPNEHTNYYTGWCLEVHDLCSSKLLANRDKDRAFVQALVTHDLVSVSTIRERVLDTPYEDARKQVTLSWIDSWSTQPNRYVEPTLPMVPDNLPDHPASFLERGSQPEGSASNGPAPAPIEYVSTSAEY